MCKDMAEKKDVAMNTFPQVTNAEYIYAEGANLNQVKIKKSDLLNKMFQNRGIIKDANAATYAGYYRIDSDVQNIPYDGYGILLVFTSAGYILQIYSGGSKILVRKGSGSNIYWSDWRSVTLT